MLLTTLLELTICKIYERCYKWHVVLCIIRQSPNNELQALWVLPKRNIVVVGTSRCTIERYVDVKDDF